jgi:hypothetical protein
VILGALRRPAPALGHELPLDCCCRWWFWRFNLITDDTLPPSPRPFIQWVKEEETGLKRKEKKKNYFFETPGKKFF